MNALGILHLNNSSWAAGWSEVYYASVSGYSAMQAILSSIWGVRKAALCADVSLVGGLISDTDVKGDSYPLGITTPDVGTFSIDSGGISANAVFAMRATFFAGTLKRGIRWVHGLPLDRVGVGGVYSPITGWTTAVNAWLSLVQTTCSSAHRIAGATSPPFYSLTPYTSYSLVLAILSRKIGRPFFQRHGRRMIA